MQEGGSAVSEGGFGKQQPRTPAKQDNDQENREKEAAKGNWWRERRHSERPERNRIQEFQGHRQMD